MTEHEGHLEQAAEIFERASQLQGDPRKRYLDEVCGGDASLRAEINSMLDAHTEQGEFLASPTQGDDDPQGQTTKTSEHKRTGEGPGTVIGRYKLLQRIGEGGFGTVYMAEQQEPVRRKVALKIIKLGMDTKQVIARFEAERQALAMMDHPHIAKVFDAGATETGRPYFVMELVKGIPITDYCDQENLSTRERLDLFMPVCHAVQHAHQKGIIHRDIKPSNVMVTLHDGKPVPKVIDFGIAKATDHRLTEKTVFTEFRQLVGTPAYMSPEQAEMSGLDVDTRTDIYSLGVLLYELLTGTTPFDAEKLRGAAYGEIQRIIREVEPPRPSTRLSTLGADQLTGVARHRKAEPRALSRLIRGDLDWIVMKALEKDRTRRYETAKELARDVEHHLANQPTVAGPPQASYKLRKFIKRNRVAVTAGSLVAAAMLLGLIISTIGFVQARRHRARAEVAASEAEAARQAETVQRQAAEDERDRAQEAEQAARLAEQQAQRQAYLANISAAAGALAFNESSKARRHLDAAPPEFRNWEWRYLDAQTDDSLAVLRGHKGNVWALAISPQGTYLASGAPNNIIVVYDPVTGKELAVLRGHDDEVIALAFDPGETRLASGSTDGMVRIWDVKKTSGIATLRGHEGNVNWLAFSPDGTLLASASDDATVRLWDVATGTEKHVLRHGSAIYCIAFNPDGTRLASASWDTTVRLWDPLTGEEIATFRGHTQGVSRIAFSPDGTRLVSGSYDGTVRLWEVPGGAEVAVLRGHESTVDTVAFSSDGTRVASGSWDATVRLWDVASGRESAVLRKHTGRVRSVLFTSDGNVLASAGDSTIRLWDATSGEQLAVLSGHEIGIWEAAFSPDGSWLASTSSDGTVRIWDTSPHRAPSVLRGHKRAVESVVFSPDGFRLTSGSRDGTIRLWDASTGSELVVLRGHEKEVFSVAYSPDGSRLASGSLDGTIRIWDAYTGEEVAVLRGANVEVTEVAFGPSGGQIASAHGDGSVRLWDTTSLEEVAVLRGHEKWVGTLAFSSNGARLASGSDDQTVRVWDLATEREMHVLRGHNWTVRSVAFSPDGAYLASASDDLRLWDVTTGGMLFATPEGGAVSVTFSPDGTRLISGHGDKTVRVWDASSGEELLTLAGHGLYVMSVAFSPDGTRLASGSYDNTVRIWDTLPYRIRYTERQTMRAARPDAERVVDRLWEQFSDASSIAKQLREDDSLSTIQRREALNLLLKKSIRLQEHVNALFARLVFTGDVVAALESDDSVTPAVRHRAVAFARARDDRPLRLHWDSWNLVRAPGGDIDAYEVGLRGAQAAVASEPRDLTFLITLGVAQYRTGRYEDAYMTLSRCTELQRQRTGKASVPDLAVLSMALVKLGRQEEAQAVFDRLENVINDHTEGLRYYDPEAAKWFEEAQASIHGDQARVDSPEGAEGDE